MATELPLVNVTVRLVDQDGDPVAGAKVSAKLMTVERYKGYVIPEEYLGVTDDQGTCIIRLFPNELGTEGSEYRFKISYPKTSNGKSLPSCQIGSSSCYSQGSKSLTVYASIPNADCNLEDVCDLDPYPIRGSGQIFTEQVLSAAEDAKKAAQDVENIKPDIEAAKQAAITATTKASIAESAATIAGLKADESASKAAESSSWASRAKEWAESTSTPDPYEPDSKSAKSWASQSRAWAESPTSPDQNDPNSKSAKSWSDEAKTHNEQMPVKATGTTTPRPIADHFADVANVKDFGAKGNGVTDDTAAIQAAVNAAVGKLLIVPSGKYNIVGTGIQIPSNVTINLDPNACMYQRGCYRYDNRDTPGSYVPANVVDYNIFWMDNGVENVTISGGKFYGPFYRDGGDYSEQDDSDYDSSRAVESWPASNGIVVRGDDYYAVRKGMPFCTKRSKNITLTGGYYEGWAEDAIQLDQVDNSKVLSNTITRCGRGGVRLYGCHNAWVMFNDISYIYPGDYLNGKNRMYGVTATKVYKPESTYSDNVWMVCNRVYHIPYWKSLDTHGGRRIRFLNNDCRESHIGIGVDKGGESERNGYFPPNDVVIAGNYLLRTLPDSPFEGNATDYGPEYGCAGDGITLFAGQRQDGVDTGLIFGKTAKIYGNTLIGWGGTETRGALSVSNWQDVNEHDNSIQNSRRCALYISNETQGSFGYGDTIDDVRPSSAGVQLGVTVNPVQTPDGVRGMCDVNIDGIRFINRQESDLTCIELPMSADGYSIIYGSGFSYKNYGTGKIIKYTSNIQYSSPASLIRSQSIAQARVNLDGTLYSNSFNFGVKSCVKSDTGTYMITLDAPALNKYSAIPLAVAVGQGYLANATMTDEQTVTVLTYRSNTLSDAGFNLVVMGY